MIIFQIRLKNPKRTSFIEFLRETNLGRKRYRCRRSEDMAENRQAPSKTGRVGSSAIQGENFAHFAWLDESRDILLIHLVIKSVHLYIQGSKINGRKDVKCAVFSVLHLKIVTGTTKNACAYFSKCSTKIVPFYLCPNPKCVFSVFNFQNRLKMQSIYILRCRGLQFNWFVSVVSSQPPQFYSGLETSGSNNTCSNV